MSASVRSRCAHDALTMAPSFGVGFGGSYPARATVVADRFGTEAYGQINGVIAFLMTLTAALGLLTLSAVTARFDTYEGAMLLVALGSVVAVGAIVSLEVFSPITRRQAPGETELTAELTYE